MTKPTEDTTLQSDNPLGMSDEEIMNMSSPSQLAAAEPENEEDTAETTTTETADEDAETETETPEKEGEEEKSTTSTGNDPENGDNTDTTVKTGKADPAKSASDPAAESTDEANTDAQTKDGKATDKGGKPESGDKANEPASVDYQSFYDAVMKPIKANGKTVEIRTPEEAIQLMQMGANYTRKMQDIAPHRKTLLMLENNGLLDQDKLSFLIDLDKKNPDAIKKLIKDSGIDPMDFDPNEQVQYTKGNHTVTDEEANFRSNLDDLKSTPDGLETLRTINDSWDQASKEIMWANPDVMTVIHQQRTNGIYDRIAGEVERQRTLGHLPANVSFLQAYKTIGDQMHAQNAFADLVSPAGSKETPETPVKQPIETKAAKPKTTVKNNEKAQAAAQTRATSTQKASQTKNPLSLSDEEFMKQFENIRL